MGGKDVIIHCDWRAYPQDVDVAIIVDVLSFSTCVSVAVERQAIIYPFYLGPVAEKLAKAVDAVCAGPRRSSPFSLSPDSMRKVNPGQKLILPSPNGASLTLLQKAPIVLAGCLRNAKAIANYANRHGKRILIIPAGELQKDGAVRFALEDQIGAGAIIAQMEGDLTPQAEAAKILYQQFASNMTEVLARSTSGVELMEMGYPQDVRAAAQINISSCVPLLVREQATYRSLLNGNIDIDMVLKNSPICRYQLA